MRAAGRLAIALLILATLGSSADVLVSRYAEDLVADGLQREFDLPKRPAVRLSGFPFVIRALRGNLPDVDVSVSDFEVRELKIASFRATMRSVTSVGSLFGGELQVRVGEGEATLVMDDAGLNALLRDEGERATISVGEDRVVVRTSFEFRGTRRVVAGARVQLSGNVLTVRPIRSSIRVDGEPPPPGFAERAAAEATLRVELPELPGGIEPSSITLEPGRATVVATLSGRSIEVR